MTTGPRKCRSCGAVVVRAMNARDLPVDVEPSERGRLVMTNEQDGRAVVTRVREATATERTDALPLFAAFAPAKPRLFAFHRCPNLAPRRR